MEKQYIYYVYKDDELVSKQMTKELAKEYCIHSAKICVELDKQKVYYPILRKIYNVENITDIPAEIRYKYWDEQRVKYLREHYYVKKIDITPSEERVQAFRKKAAEYKKKKNIK